MRTLWLRAGAVDLERGVLASDDVDVALGAREVRLLRALAERVGHDVPRDALYAAVWDEPVDASSRALDVAVARLREKIERDPARPEHLLTVRGVGYRFAPLATEVAAPPKSVARLIRLGGVRVDLDRCLAERDGAEVLLSAQEAGVLRVLADADGSAVTPEVLHRSVWGARLPTGSRAVVRTIGRLRQKLESDPADPRHLVTARGDGFRLLIDPADARPLPIPAHLVRAAVKRARDMVARQVAGEPSALAGSDEIVVELGRAAATDLRIEAAAALGALLCERDDHIGAIAALEPIARETGDPEMRLGAILDLALACRRSGRLSDALGWVTFGIDEAVAHGSPREAQARVYRASMSLAAGDPEAAERDARRAAAIEGPWRADAELELAIVLAASDRLEAALVYLRSARIALTLANRAAALLRAESIEGRLLADAGSFDEAAARFESGRDRARQIEARWSEAQLTMYLGRVRQLQGNLDLSRRESADAERQFRALASPSNIVVASLQQALVDLEQGNAKAALATLLEIAPAAANHPGNRVLVRVWAAWARAVVGQRRVAESMLADLPASLPYRGVDETVARIRAAVRGDPIGPPATVDGRLADRVLRGASATTSN